MTLFSLNEFNTVSLVRLEKLFFPYKATKIALYALWNIEIWIPSMNFEPNVYKTQGDQKYRK